MFFDGVVVCPFRTNRENKGTHKSISNQEKEILNEKKDLRFDRFFLPAQQTKQKKIIEKYSHHTIETHSQRTH